MALQIVRFEIGGDICWGVHKDGHISVVSGDYETTGDFFTKGGVEAAYALDTDNPIHRIEDVTLLSPVTNDAEYICQGMNYGSHLKEIGRNPADHKLYILFQKASSSIAPPNVDIVRPSHVQLLDYEAELGLVISQPIAGPIDVTADIGTRAWRAGQSSKEVCFLCAIPSGPLDQPAEFHQ